MKNKTTLTVAFFALAFVLTLGSCAKKQVKNDIEGTWAMTEFLANGEVLFIASPGNTWVWTFDNGAVSSVRSYMDGATPITETDESNYKIKKRGNVIKLGGYDYTINELTETTLIIQSEHEGEIGILTFNK